MFFRCHLRNNLSPLDIPLFPYNTVVYFIVYYKDFLYKALKKVDMAEII